jgi:predicted AAA+ superfamily ATPase
MYIPRKAEKLVIKYLEQFPAVGIMGPRQSGKSTMVRKYSGHAEWFNSYVETYLQKDLRQMLNIADLHVFTQFIRMLAVQVSQVLNLSSISRDIGVSVNTLKRWLSVLENSYIVFLLHPYFKNQGKRIIKSPKVFFYDTGLISFLSGISTVEQWEKSILYGPLFENFIIADIYKQILHSGYRFNLYYYRTSHGDEIDLIIDRGQKVNLIEIKASVSYRPGFQKTLEKYEFGETYKQVLYQGESSEKTSGIFAENYLSFLKEFPGKSTA